MRMALALAIAAAPAHAWRIKHTSTGAPMRWGAGPLVYALHGGGTDDIDGVGEQVAIADALATWSHAIDGVLPMAESATPGGAASGDGVSEVVFTTDWPPCDCPDQSDALALTVLRSDPASGQILEADVFVNDNYTWAIVRDGEPHDGAKFDLENTLAHEFGHVLGLDHELVHTEATMFEGSTPWETSKRDLAQDDIDGITMLYFNTPVPGAPAQDGAPMSTQAYCALAGDGEGPGIGALSIVGALLWRRRRMPVRGRGR